MGAPSKNMQGVIQDIIHEVSMYAAKNGSCQIKENRAAVSSVLASPLYL